jgi:glucosamine--fructose-6-phosphate aminotransferase (isomerizing)
MLLAFEKAFAQHASRLSELGALVDAAPGFLRSSHDVIYEEIRTVPRRVYVLGAGIRYGIALEGTLKSLEMSNQNVSAYGPLEFRHGPWGSVTADDLVVILGQSRYAAHERQVLRDLAQRTPHLVVVAQPAWFGDESWPARMVQLPDSVDDLWSGPLAVLPLQWLGFYWALAVGQDPDAPKNLTPVVDLRYESR